MKNMGEFERRLIAESSTRDDNTVGGLIFVKKACEIIEEVRRGFPVWWKVKAEDRVYQYFELTEEQKKQATIHSLDVRKTIKWFKKWFLYHG